MSKMKDKLLGELADAERAVELARQEALMRAARAEAGWKRVPLWARYAMAFGGICLVMLLLTSIY